MFCTRAGAVWRQLAVLSLCPWLAKYRVFGEERLSNALLSFQKSSDEAREDDKDVAEQLQDRVGALQDTIGGLGGAIEDVVPVQGIFPNEEVNDARASSWHKEH